MSHSGPFKKPNQIIGAPAPLPVPRKRRRNPDPDWTPAFERASKRRKKNTSFKPNVPITQLNAILMSPAKNVCIVSEHGIGMAGVLPFDELNKVQPSTPAKGVLTSSIQDDEQVLLRARTIESHHGKISIFLDSNKVERTEIIPQTPPKNIKEKLEQLRFPLNKNDGIVDLCITQDTLKEIKREKCQSKRENRSVRYPTNKQVTKVSANVVAASLNLEAKDWQWWHMAGHSLWGNASQNMANFILGKKHGNSKMNDLAESLVENLLKELAKTHSTPKLYLSVDVVWVPGFEAARLAKNLIWTLKDGSLEKYEHMVRFEFNPLSTAKISQSEIDSIKTLLTHLFLEDKTIEIQSPNGKKAEVKSPSKKISVKKSNFVPIPFGLSDVATAQTNMPQRKSAQKNYSK